MKTMDRKGQGAMEYLMTYGWAILVVMIVGVVLWQLGIFGGGPGAVNTATGFSKIKPMEPSIRYSDNGAADGTLKFTIMNGAGTPIVGLCATPSGDCTTCPIVDCPVGDGSFGQGETEEVTLTGCPKVEGTTFSVSVTFNYTQSVGMQDVVHADSGAIKGTVEA